MSEESTRSLVALMFTDLVGSVALQQRLGTAAYIRYVARHDEIFQECLAEFRGAKVLNETGDGFLLRLDDPSDALNMALRLQSRCHDESCEGERIRIRIGLHLGVVTVMDERIRGEKRVVGMPVNLAARIMDLADGGQILMTRAVYEDARNHVKIHPARIDQIPPKLKWQSYGLYDFKGAPEPMEIFEVGAEGIAPFLPPEGSGKARRTSPSDHQNPGANAADQTTPVEIFSPESLRRSDVFICHAAVDDEPLMAGREGWVTQFHRNLKVRMEQLMGQPVQVWRDTGPRDTERVRQILSFLPEAKSLVSVLSPTFVNAEECVRELAEFGRSDRGCLRLISAEKTPVDADEMPEDVANLISGFPPFPFYERDPNSGRVREFNEAYGEKASQRFHESVYDVAYELKQRLRARADLARESGAPSAQRKTVYLAQTSSDLRQIRDQLRRELLESGHRVLPDRLLPQNASELLDVVREYLAEADLAVHLVGDRYGFIPEDASNSVVELQNMASVEAHEKTGLARIIWSSREVLPNDERQAKFLQQLVEDPKAHQGAELIQDTLENLSGIVLQKLAPEKEPGKIKLPARAAGAHPTVYLIHDQRDEEAVEETEDFLFDHGIEVATPHFDGDEAEVSRMHRKNLLRCDAVLVYYGQASKTWVEMQMLDVVQAPGYGRETPMLAQAVFIAGSMNRRKARFRTHLGEVIREDTSTPGSGSLEQFVTKVSDRGLRDASNL